MTAAYVLDRLLLARKLLQDALDLRAHNDQDPEVWAEWAERAAAWVAVPTAATAPRSNHYAGPVCGVMLGSTCSHPLGHRGPCDIPEDDPAPASTGVPRCPGEIWTTSTDQMTPCTLPLGHHGGCR